MSSNPPSEGGTGGGGIIIIKRAAGSPKLSADERSFLVDVAGVLEVGGDVDRDTQVHVQQLLGKAVFG